MTPLFYTTAEDAEEAFYEAISQVNLDALMAVWSDDDEIVCIHPTGHRLDGHAAIRESWRAIFESNPRFSMRIHSKVRWESALISVHCVVETLYLQKDRTTHGPMLSTNVFARGANGWRLVSRHSSAAIQAPENGEENASGGHRHTLH
ncbi:MAG: nuclear transport factor 2 family protein [Candidatus Accumulibacter sp.]|jgi:ketosteroid isomerase-like protein|nr:nuclear transport factor 2 family protein [Accumulibacter sp.]